MNDELFSRIQKLKNLGCEISVERFGYTRDTRYREVKINGKLVKTFDCDMYDNPRLLSFLDGMICAIENL